MHWAAMGAADGKAAQVSAAPAEAIDDQQVAAALCRFPRIILGTSSSARRGSCFCHDGTLPPCLLPPCSLPPSYFKHPLPAGAFVRTAGVMDELTVQYSFQYEIAKADIDESAIRHDEAHQLVLSLAHAKADAIRAKLQAAGNGDEGLLVTCDQVGAQAVCLT